jgi:hypothetical protein
MNRVRTEQADHLAGWGRAARRACGWQFTTGEPMGPAAETALALSAAALFAAGVGGEWEGPAV